MTRPALLSVEEEEEKKGGSHCLLHLQGQMMGRAGGCSEFSGWGARHSCSLDSIARATLYVYSRQTDTRTDRQTVRQKGSHVVFTALCST